MKADRFLDILTENGFGPYTGVPCSLVKDLINCVERSDRSRYYTATSEGEAMGIAAGFSLSGRSPVVIMQNNGLGNAVNPLTSLQLLYELPVLLIITWRAEPGGRPDAPQHRIMGEILPGLLDLMKIPYAVLGDGEDGAIDAMRSAKGYLVKKKRPYALIVPRGFFEPETRIRQRPQVVVDAPLRIDCIRALAEKAGEEDVIVATTGYTGREMLQEVKRDRLFYMAGSMGCITSIGLGLALEHPRQRVFVLDGDGALLMKLGTLATIGSYGPKNLVHILFDNGLYESTGGQKTASAIVDFPKLALNSGYRYAESAPTFDRFLHFLDTRRNDDGPIMCHVKIRPGTLETLNRPKEPCVVHKDVFMKDLRRAEQLTNR